MGGPGAVGAVDGRTARALRTRERIVDGCIALVEAGDLRPTAPRIADRAGVSVRSVFQHFEDLETLFTAVADRYVDQASALAGRVEPDLPFEARVRRFVTHRSMLLETVTPMRRAANVHAPGSPEVAKRLREAHDFLRREVAVVFGPELDTRPAADRRQLLDALDATLSWSTWDTLRTLLGRSTDAARGAVERIVRALLTAST